MSHQNVGCQISDRKVNDSSVSCRVEVFTCRGCAARAWRLEVTFKFLVSHCLDPVEDGALVTRACYSPPMALRPGQVRTALHEVKTHDSTIFDQVHCLPLLGLC